MCSPVSRFLTRAVTPSGSCSNDISSVENRRSPPSARALLQQDRLQVVLAAQAPPAGAEPGEPAAGVDLLEQPLALVAHQDPASAGCRGCPPVPTRPPRCAAPPRPPGTTPWCARCCRARVDGSRCPSDAPRACAAPRGARGTGRWTAPPGSRRRSGRACGGRLRRRPLPRGSLNASSVCRSCRDAVRRGTPLHSASPGTVPPAGGTRMAHGSLARPRGSRAHRDSRQRSAHGGAGISDTAVAHRLPRRTSTRRRTSHDEEERCAG